MGGQRNIWKKGKDLEKNPVLDIKFEVPIE